MISAMGDLATHVEQVFLTATFSPDSVLPNRPDQSRYGLKSARLAVPGCVRVGIGKLCHQVSFKIVLALQAYGSRWSGMRQQDHGSNQDHKKWGTIIRRNLNRLDLARPGLDQEKI